MSSFIKPKYTGIRFKNKKLYRFSEEKIMVFRPWEPFPAVWVKTFNEGWKNIRPTNKLPFFFTPLMKRTFDKNESTLKEIYLKREKILLDLSGLLPRGVKSVVQSFSNRQFHVLCLLHKTGNLGATFAKINPVLFYALSSLWVYHPLKSSHLRAADRLISKQRMPDIVRYLGFNSKYSKSVEKLLRKIKSNAVDVVGMLRFRQMLSEDDNVLMLSHFPRKIGKSTFMFICHSYHLNSISQSLLMNLNEKEMKEFYNTIWDIYNMKKTLTNLDMPFKRNNKFCSEAGLKEYHNYLIPKVNSLKTTHEIAFPIPVISGISTKTLSIEPITNSKMLLQAGIENHNCIFAFLEEIFLGSMYAYNIYYPENGNIMLIKTGNNWELKEASKAYNIKFTEYTMVLIRDWVQDLWLNPDQLTLFEEANF